MVTNVLLQTYEYKRTTDEATIRERFMGKINQKCSDKIKLFKTEWEVSK